MPRKSTILLVANYESDVGYAWWLMESYWAAIARAYSPAERIVLAYPKLSGVPRAIADAPVEPIELEVGRGGPRELWYQLRFIVRNRVRTIYFTDRDAVDWRYFAYRAFGVRTIIVHDHTPGVRTASEGWRAILKGLLHRLPLVTATGLIGASEFVTERHRIVNRFPATRCIAVPNGLPDADSSTALDLHSAYGIPPEKAVIVSVGRAHPVKDIATALRAVQILVKERGISSLHYLHLGDGPQLDELRALSGSLGVAPWVSLPGRSDEVAATLRACTVAIHPSRAEVGFSLAILECMRAGLPTVVADNPSVRGAIEPEVTGLWFTCGSAASAADALERLLRDPDLRGRLGRAAALRQREEYDLRVTHRRLVAAVAMLRNRSLD